MAEKTRDASGREFGIGLRVVAWTRYVALVPVVGLLVGAVTLIVMASITAVGVISHIVAGDMDMKLATVEFIEIADVYLLAIVLYIISLGLFELFVDDRLPLPSWLEIRHLDDLKEKLVSVVIVVLGVSFLGKVIEGTDYLQLLYLGAGVAAVIGALTYFVGRVLGKKDKKV